MKYKDSKNQKDFRNRHRIRMIFPMIIVLNWILPFYSYDKIEWLPNIKTSFAVEKSYLYCCSNLPLNSHLSRLWGIESISSASVLWIDNSVATDFDDSQQFWSKNHHSTITQKPLRILDQAIVRGQSLSSSWNVVYADDSLAAEAARANAPVFVAQTESTLTPTVTDAPVFPETSVAPATTNLSTVDTIERPYFNNETISLSPSSNANSSAFSDSVNKVMRFWNKLSADYIFIPKNGSKGLGINEFNFNSRFAIPCNALSNISYQSQTSYFFIVPGFSLDLWSGMNDAAAPYKMPSSTFDANLGFQVVPQITQDFGIEAWVSVGLASSFKKIKTDSIYVRGKAVGNLVITDNATLTGGVIYYCRNRYKLLPSGGIIWKPNSKNELRIVFPDPKISHYLKKINETDWWAYIQGDIGGGRWLISYNGETFNTDYNDYRVGGGLCFNSLNGLSGNIEIGGAFGRELYAFGGSWYKPKTSVYIKGGLAY